MTPQKKTVLFVIDTLSRGGAEKILTTLVQHLDPRKYDVTLCCLCNVGEYIDEVKPYVHYCFVLPNYVHLKGLSLLWYKVRYKMLYCWLSEKWAYRLFIPKHHDIEIAFLEGNSTRILSGSTNPRARKFAWVHMDMKEISQYDLPRGCSEKETAVYNSYDKIITVSDTAKEAFRKTYPKVYKPLATLYNPVDREEILEKARMADDVPVRASSRIRLVSTGRLAPQKAFSRLVSIVGKLRDEGIDTDLWILGEGALMKDLKNQINDLQLSDRVRMWGFQENPHKFMAQCDLFVCSSVAEGFSTAATEAIILGLPVVTTRCSGMDELLLGGECGVITDNSEDALFEGLKALLLDRNRMDTLKAAAAKRSLSFSLEARMAAIEALLDSE